MQFAVCSSYNRHGAWGLTYDIGKPDRNSLFAAARALIGAREPPPAPAGADAARR